MGLLNEAIGLGVPVVAVPTANLALIRHPAFLRSIAQLRACGVRVLFDPDRYPLPTPNMGAPGAALFPWDALFDELVEASASRFEKHPPPSWPGQLAAMGDAAVANVTVQVHAVDGKDLCRVHVRPSAFPVEAEVVVDRKGQFERKTAFYVRLANGTREIDDPLERERYIAGRWTAPAA